MPSAPSPRTPESRRCLSPGGCSTQGGWHWNSNKHWCHWKNACRWPLHDVPCPGAVAKDRTVLVCGSRDWTDERLIMERLYRLWAIGFRKLIHGMARGADSLAGDAALRQGYEVQGLPAEWTKYHKGAGPIRNQQMLDEGKPDLVMAFKERPVSRGTDDMLRRSREAGVPTIEYWRDAEGRLTERRE